MVVSRKLRNLRITKKFAGSRLEFFRNYGETFAHPTVWGIHFRGPIQRGASVRGFTVRSGREMEGVRKLETVLESSAPCVPAEVP